MAVSGVKVFGFVLFLRRSGDITRLPKLSFQFHFKYGHRRQPLYRSYLFVHPIPLSESNIMCALSYRHLSRPFVLPSSRSFTYSLGTVIHLRWEWLCYTKVRRILMVPTLTVHVHSYQLLGSRGFMYGPSFRKCALPPNFLCMHLVLEAALSCSSLAYLETSLATWNPTNEKKIALCIRPERPELLPLGIIPLFFLFSLLLGLFRDQNAPWRGLLCFCAGIKASQFTLCAASEAG